MEQAKNSVGARDSGGQQGNRGLAAGFLQRRVICRAGLAAQCGEQLLQGPRDAESHTLHLNFLAVGCQEQSFLEGPEECWGQLHGPGADFVQSFSGQLKQEMRQMMLRICGLQANLEMRYRSGIM